MIGLVGEGSLRVDSVPSLPIVQTGEDLVSFILDGFCRAGMDLKAHDVVVLTSKVVSRSQGRFVNLQDVIPGEESHRLAAITEKDPRMVELIRQESQMISRVAAGVLIVKNKQGVVGANAGIDLSNSRPAGADPDSGPWALLPPVNPDGVAKHLIQGLELRGHSHLGMVITDSLGRPFRHGTVGCAIGVAGLPALCSMNGKEDLFGRVLEHTITALADQVAAVADLVAGQSAEGRAIVRVRGLKFISEESSASQLLRSASEDLYL